MTPDVVYNFITSLGFPIVMCIILIFLVTKLIEKHQSERQNLTDNYITLLNELATVVRNNTEMVSRLNEKIDILLNGR